MKTTQKVAKKTAVAIKSARAFTAEERAAMKERAGEMKSARKGKADGESVLLAKIATMKGTDRTMAERVHSVVKAAAPTLVPTTWYGMPAYARDDGKVVCFFRDAAKFKSRYATLGFSDKASLDDGGMWPTDFALKELTPATEARIAALVKKAVG